MVYIYCLLRSEAEMMMMIFFNHNQSIFLHEVAHFLFLLGACKRCYGGLLLSVSLLDQTQVVRALYYYCYF